jgi:hypothetical protein
MDVPIPSSAGSRADPVSAAVSTRTASRADVAGKAGAWVVLLGTAITTVGLSWDVQWHVEVGPDTFFTLSHLALYSGSALSGIASLVMVLLATSAQRAGNPMPRWVGGTPVRVFGGAFTAPLGYLIAGIGAASFLLYGLLDLVWHSIYGFDAVLNTPSHVALFLSITLTMVGSLIVFASAQDQRWGRLGIVLVMPILITFAPIAANGLSNLPLPVDPTILAIIFVSPMLLIIGRGILRREGGAIAIAVALGALQAFLWWFSPWAAEVYAAASGLPLRDGLTPAPPQLPGAIPMFLIVAAVAVEALFRLIRTRGLNARKTMPLVGAVAGLIVGVSLPLQRNLILPTSNIPLTTTALITVIGTLLGILAGFLGARFITMSNALAPATKEAR